MVRRKKNLKKSKLNRNGSRKNLIKTELKSHPTDLENPSQLGLQAIVQPTGNHMESEKKNNCTKKVEHLLDPTRAANEPSRVEF